MFPNKRVPHEWVGYARLIVNIRSHDMNIINNIVSQARPQFKRRALSIRDDKALRVNCGLACETNKQHW